MTTLEEIGERLDRIEEAVSGTSSPWLRGDLSAANWAGYKSAKAFKKWASSRGIRPAVDSGLNFWSKRDIERERGGR